MNPHNNFCSSDHTRGVYRGRPRRGVHESRCVWGTHGVLGCWRSSRAWGSLLLKGGGPLLIESKEGKALGSEGGSGEDLAGFMASRACAGE
jgi:hypothetical protein